MRGRVLNLYAAADGAIPLDRRVRRSRAALHRAVVALTLDRGFGALTVDDIAERADVTRATFYRHYPNKEDLLADVAQGFADDIIASFAEHQPGTSRLVPLFEQARRSAELTRIILDGEGDGVALRRFTANIDDLLRRDLATGTVYPNLTDLDRELVVRARTGLILAALSWFIDHPEADVHTTAAQVTRIFEGGWGPSR